jgi:hypothetical protein
MEDFVRPPRDAKTMELYPMNEASDQGERKLNKFLNEPLQTYLTVQAGSTLFRLDVHTILYNRKR